MANSLKIILGAVTFRVTQFTSKHYHVKRRCSKLSHNAVIISIRLLAFASSIRRRVPHDLVLLWFKYSMLEYSTLKVITDNFSSALSSKWSGHSLTSQSLMPLSASEVVV